MTPNDYLYSVRRTESTDGFSMACPASTHALWRHATDVTVRGLASPRERQRGIGARTAKRE